MVTNDGMDASKVKGTGDGSIGNSTKCLPVSHTLAKMRRLSYSIRVEELAGTRREGRNFPHSFANRLLVDARDAWPLTRRVGNNLPGDCCTYR